MLFILKHQKLLEIPITLNITGIDLWTCIGPLKFDQNNGMDVVLGYKSRAKTLALELLKRAVYG